MLFDLLRGNLTFANAVVEIIVILIIVFLILPLHEWAHGITAHFLGDDTAKLSGRLTLNPLSHIDPFGALALLLFNFGWAKPVPIDSRNFKKPRLGTLLVALMGPVSNLVAALVGCILYNLIYTIFGSAVYVGTTAGSIIYLFFSTYCSINLTLAVFNLIPIPPLDGSKILFAFLPTKALYAIQKYSQYFFILIFVLLFSGILTVPLNFLTQNIGSAIQWLADLPFPNLR